MTFLYIHILCIYIHFFPNFGILIAICLWTKLKYKICMLKNCFKMMHLSHCHEPQQYEFLLTSVFWFSFHVKLVPLPNIMSV